jgi:hypothetical protein
MQYWKKRIYQLGGGFNMIETHDRKHLNIKDLMFVEPASMDKPFFDPKDYLDQSDIEIAHKMYSNSFHKSSWLKNLYDLKIIMPEVFDAAIEDKAIEELNEEIRNTRTGDNWYMSQEKLAKALIAMPDKRDHLAIDNRASRRLIGRANQKRNGFEWHAYIDAYLNLKVINPEQAKKVTVDKKSFEGLKHEVRSKWANNIGFNFDLAAKTRVACPQFTDAYTPTDEEWKKIRQALAEYKNSTPGVNYEVKSNFYNFLAAATILGAHDVKLSGKGLEIVLVKPNKVQEVNTKMPEGRRF